MSNFANASLTTSSSISYRELPTISFDKVTGSQHTCETARSRSTSAGTSNSCGSSNTDQYSARVQNDLWGRFQESLTAAELHFADLPCEEKELTELLGELGFTAVERARLRRACRSRVHEPVQEVQPAQLHADAAQEHQEKSRVSESVFLTGDFFGDDAGLTVGSVVAAGLESPSAALSVVEKQAEPSIPANMDENVFLTGDFFGDNVFLTGDFFGDDVAVVTSCVPPVSTVVENLPTIPPPPLAPPLVHMQSQMPLIPAPAGAPALDRMFSPQLPLLPHSVQMPAVPMQQPIVGSLELQQSIPSKFQELLSIGSWEHHLGTCKPCAYFGERGCQSGAQCEYCHLCVPGELKRRQKARRSAQRRMRYMPGFEGSA